MKRGWVIVLAHLLSMRYSQFVMMVTIIFLTPAFSLAQETVTDPDVITFPGFQKDQKDESASVTFDTPPGHIESPSIAKKNGLFKCYTDSSHNEGESPVSFMTVTFQGKSSEWEIRNLDDFVSTDIKYFHDVYKNGTVTKVSLPNDVTAHLAEGGIPFQTVIFAGNVKGDGKKFLGDGMVLFFETPGGFWSVSWSAPGIMIMAAYDAFFIFIKDMKVSILSKKP